jgi:hypothetical protein
VRPIKSRGVYIGESVSELMGCAKRKPLLDAYGAHGKPCDETTVGQKFRAILMAVMPIGASGTEIRTFRPLFLPEIWTFVGAHARLPPFVFTGSGCSASRRILFNTVPIVLCSLRARCRSNSANSASIRALKVSLLLKMRFCSPCLRMLIQCVTCIHLSSVIFLRKESEESQFAMQLDSTPEGTFPETYVIES